VSHATFSPGRLYVRRAVAIAAAPAEVWPWFTTFEALATWFSRGHTLLKFEPEINGAVELSVELEDGLHHFGGRITHYEPCRRLTLTNNWFDDLAWPTPTYLTFLLTAQREGTLVELFHHGFDALGDIGASECLAYEQGWDTKHLIALREAVAAHSAADQLSTENGARGTSNLLGC